MRAIITTSGLDSGSTNREIADGVNVVEHHYVSEALSEPVDGFNLHQTNAVSYRCTVMGCSTNVVYKAPSWDLAKATILEHLKNMLVTYTGIETAEVAQGFEDRKVERTVLAWAISRVEMLEPHQSLDIEWESGRVTLPRRPDGPTPLVF